VSKETSGGVVTGLENQVSISGMRGSPRCLDLLWGTATYPVCRKGSFLRGNLSWRGADPLNLAKNHVDLPSPSHTSSWPNACLSTGTTVCLVTVS
jgi:hypothetical protein